MTLVTKFIPKNILNIYEKNENEEILLGEDCLLEQLTKYIELYRIVNFRKFIHSFNTLSINDSFKNANEKVKKLLNLANISSSDSQNVLTCSILRRISVDLI